MMVKGHISTIYTKHREYNPLYNPYCILRTMILPARTATLFAVRRQNGNWGAKGTE